MEQKGNNPQNNKPGNDKRPKSSILVTLIIAIAIAVVIGTVYNIIVSSQYTQTTYTEFLQALEDNFPAFLEEQLPTNPQKAEYLLPRTVDQLLKEGKATVKILSSRDRWYGVTYAEDKPVVVAALAELTKQGKYPDGLWK